MKYQDYKNDSIYIDTIKNQNLIKVLRKQSGLTQKELAQKLNVSQQEISKLERSEASINLNTLTTICNELNIFPIITFTPNQYTMLTDLQLIDCYSRLLELPKERQDIIYELLKLLS